MDRKCAGIAVAVMLSACLAAAKEPAGVDQAWDAIFTRTSGWTGGDVAGTVDLGGGRVLWLFGDSWIGEVAEGRHKPGAKMVNNSIAIQSLTGKPSDFPAKSDIQFYWHGGSKSPAAWIIPNPVQTAIEAKQSDSDPKLSSGWYWPTGGGIVVPGPSGRPRLVVFLFHIGKQEGKESVWAFKSLGGTMAIVDNVSDPVEKWNVRQFDIPFAVGSDAANGPAKKIAHPREISWGVAAFHDRPSEGRNADWLYIYGIRNESPLNRQVILARARIDSLSRFDEWQFYAGKEKWSASMDDLAPIAEHVTNELSVERMPGAGQPVWIMVHSEPPFGRKIFVRTANRPEGPWTDPAAVYSAPELDRNSAYFAYAAKGHFQISKDNELLITYVVNAHDFGAMAKDASIYRPRFIRLPLNAILPPR